MDAASKNKVLLQFLRALDIDNDLRFREEARYETFLRRLEEVESALRSLDHVFIKLKKPVSYVPLDIDVLVKRKHIAEAVLRLKSRGFRVEVVEPYTVTMAGRRIIVDLYRHPSMESIVFMDGDRLLKHRAIRSFHEIRVTS